MCGISGIWLRQRSSLNIRETIYRLSQTIKHRGPDGEGFMLASATGVEPFASEDTPSFTAGGLNYIPSKRLESAAGDHHLAFGHRRLSIIDLSDAGHQPMADSSGKFWITFNGEIYNYIELRRELEQAGHRFASNSDTEVIIAAYKEWGAGCQRRFNGMWAFCIYDVARQALFCSRDRFGVKPFYYVSNASLFAFASEQKALVKSGVVPFHINEKAVHDHLVNERIESEPESFFKDVIELFPGQQLIVDLKNGSEKLARWYNLSYEADPATDRLSDNELTAIIREKLQNSIHLRLRSDVPVGSCLSGGIDSSVIAGLVRKESTHPLYLFTSVFQNDPSDESHFAELVAKKVNGIYKTVEPTVDGLFSEIEKLVYAQDIPIWSTSTYAQYKVMELAKLNNIKVVLDGQGGDELFAGYHHHFVAKWNGLGGLELMEEIAKSERSIPHPFIFYAKEKIKQRNNRHLSKIRPYVSNEFIGSFPVINQVKYFNSVNEQLANDFGGRLKAFLKCEDRCGMTHHVESRVPFSDDTALIEFMFSVNGNRKIRQGVSKYLLREAAKDLLPEEVYKRYDKKGFETPMNSWITQNRARLFEKIDGQFPFVNTDKLGAVFKNGSAGAKEVSLLYKLYVLSVWKELFK